MLLLNASVCIYRCQGVVLGAEIVTDLTFSRHSNFWMGETPGEDQSRSYFGLSNDSLEQKNQGMLRINAKISNFIWVPLEAEYRALILKQ